MEKNSGAESDLTLKQQCCELSAAEEGANWNKRERIKR